MTKRILTIGLLLCPFIVGCGEQRESHSRSKADKPQTKLVGEGLQADLLVGEQANDYRVQLHASLKEDHLIIQREDVESGQVDMVRLADQYSYNDMFVQSGRSYKYRLGVYRNGHVQWLAETAISIPRDVVVHAVDWSPGDEPIHVQADRVFFDDPSYVTYGRDVVVEATELIFNETSLATFAKGARAADNHDGSDGGFIHLRAQTARGALQIWMRGQDGGRRLARPEPLGETYRGDPGIPGKPAQYKAYRDCLNGHHNCHVTYECITPPTSGSPGQAGKKGRSGFPGTAGGDTGQLTVEIDRSEKLTLLTHRVVGQGSEGGQGGRGSPGGPGGLGGVLYLNVPANAVMKKCSPAAPGPDGLFGADGKKGAPGANGQEQEICLRLSRGNGLQCR